MSDPAVAFYDWGRWVAGCPAEGCTNALGLERGQPAFTCVTRDGNGCCGGSTYVLWPSSPDIWEVESAISGRAPAEQSWHPGEELP